MQVPYLDWVAMGLTLGQMYLLARRKTAGWPVGIAGSALWAVWAVAGSLWSILAINAILALLALRGWYGWTRGGVDHAIKPQAADGGEQA